jgi:hypothetical protein
MEIYGAGHVSILSIVIKQVMGPVTIHDTRRRTGFNCCLQRIDGFVGATTTLYGGITKPQRLRNACVCKPGLLHTCTDISLSMDALAALKSPRSTAHVDAVVVQELLLHAW